MCTSVAEKQFFWNALKSCVKLALNRVNFNDSLFRQYLGVEKQPPLKTPVMKNFGVFIKQQFLPKTVVQ